MDSSPPGSSVHGLLQAKIPEWVAIPFPRASSWPRGRIWVFCIAGRFFTIWTTRKAPNNLKKKIQISRHSRMSDLHPSCCHSFTSLLRGPCGWARQPSYSSHLSPSPASSPSGKQRRQVLSPTPPALNSRLNDSIKRQIFPGWFIKKKPKCRLFRRIYLKHKNKEKFKVKE